MRGWSDYNPRKDFKAPRWFALNNRILEDSDFYEFDADEFKAWIYILCQCSQKNTGTVSINTSHAEKVCKIPKKKMLFAIEKLQVIGIIQNVQTTSDVLNATLHYTTEQNRTNNTIHAPLVFNFEEIYKLYPLKKGKSKGLKIANREIKSDDDFGNLGRAVLNYAKSVQGSDPKFVKHFSTFMNEWRDWLDPEAGTSTLVSINWDQEADYYIRAVRGISDGDNEGLKAFLNDENRYKCFVKIGRRRIGEMPNNQYGKKELAKLIKFTFENLNQQEAV